MEHKAGKRIPLSRGWKTLRNLVLLVVALGLCWGLTRVPLWLTQRALEVGAEEQGVEETELLWRGNLPVLFEGGGGAPFAGQDTMPVVLARSGQTVWSCHMDSYEGDIFLNEPTGRILPEGPCLICPLFSGYAAIPTQEGVTAVLAAVNLPEGTASGQAGLIRFGPDRAEVRAELCAHLEDKAADLRRIFPDMTDEEAGVQALREMGDAAEIGKEMARLHKPWLGYLWMASRVLLGLALALLAVELLLTLGLFWGLIWPI